MQPNYRTGVLFSLPPVVRGRTCVNVQLKSNNSNFYNPFWEAPYVSRHAHGPQDAQPLRSVFVSSMKTCTHILAWTKPDLNIKLHSHMDIFVATCSARVTFIVINAVLLHRTMQRVIASTSLLLNFRFMYLVCAHEYSTAGSHSDHWRTMKHP